MSSPTGPTPEAVRAALAAVVASPGFQNSDRMIRFLRYIVEKALAGTSEDVKEYSLAIEVFDRDPSFDPKIETIVRVEARRLRRKLKEYYDGPGAKDAVRIDIPTPGYTPVFIGIAPPADQPVAVMARRRRSPWLVAAPVAVAVFAVAVWMWRPSWLFGPSTANLTSVAVLPFSNLSGDPNQEYFSDGFTEELIDRLAAIDGLRIPARTSVFEFKNKPLDVREIGRKLGVESLVEGSVRRSGNTVRITAQLVRTADGYHVWSKSWDRELKDVLAVETDVAEAIAQSFRRSVAPARTSAPSLEAYDLYLLGRSHWYKGEPEEFQKAIGYFEKAIAQSPDFALAYSGLSEVYSYMIDFDFGPSRELGAKARDAADRALALDEKLAEAHTSRGLVALDADWDQPRAEREFRRAIELKPNFAYGIHWYAHYLDSRGQVDAADREMRRALQLDPLSRMIHMDVSAIAWEQRRYDVSLDEANQIRAIDPTYPLTDIADGLVYLARGENAAAAKTLRGVVEKAGPIPFALAGLGIAEALGGDRAAARRELATLERARAGGYVPAFPDALIYYALGNRDEGLRWLQRAFDDRDGGLVWLGKSPLFDVARQDPRAKVLLDRAGDASK